MINRAAIEEFKARIARHGLELSDFDLHYETAARCGSEKPEEPGVVRIRYRPSEIEKTYPVAEPPWVDEFTRDLHEGFYRTEDN